MVRKKKGDKQNGMICSSVMEETSMFSFIYEIDELRNTGLRVLLKMFVSVGVRFG